MIGKDSGQGNSQSGNMGDGVEIGGTGTVADPETFLAGSLEIARPASQMRLPGESFLGFFAFRVLRGMIASPS